MIRITLLLAVLFQPSSLRITTTPPTKAVTESTDLRKFLAELHENYKGPVICVDTAVSDLKQAWDEVRKGVLPQSSSDIIGLHKFLSRVVEEYNARLGDVCKDLEDAWEYYMIMFGKRYPPNETAMRKEIFRKNKKHLEKHNELFRKGQVSYSLKINHLSDRTPSELKKVKDYPPRNSSQRQTSKGILAKNEAIFYLHSKGPQTLPSVNWRAKGIVTPVRFQGDCSGCYAFAGIGALEAYYKKTTGNLFALSVQNILDCTWHLGNNGCDGGFIDSVFEYAESSGVELEDHYPYRMNASHNCKWANENAVARDEGYLAIPRNENDLRRAISNHGPVAAVIGTSEHFYSYGEGVFHPKNCSPAAQSVLIVGYGSDPKHGDYWLIKNSFGEWWGEDGYIRLARNKDNLCDVALDAFLPV